MYCLHCFGSGLVDWGGIAGKVICITCRGTGKELVMESEEKPNLTTLFRDNPATPEGKYLVKRRDGTVVEWPSFVLGARDPVAIVALRAYANEVERLLANEPRRATRLGFTSEFVDSLLANADKWDTYREEHGEGDPGKGKHRVDDPDTIAEMRKGMSA